ncbi:DMT family transporter [Rhodobacteraceae bacterium]|nr:DMT family transporter [Paracoccaceae bacterium]
MENTRARHETPVPAAAGIGARIALILTVLLPPLFWAGNFIVARGARDAVPPMSLVWGRWVVALVCLLPFAWPYIRRDWRLYLRHRWLVLGTTLTSVVMFNSLIYSGLQYTQAANGMLLNSTIPVLVLLIGVAFYGQRLRLLQIIGLAVSLCGVLTIILSGDFSRLLSMDFNAGDILIFGAMVAWGFFTVWLTRLPPEMSRVGLLAVQCMLGLLVLTPFWLMEIGRGVRPEPSLHALMAVLYVGIVPSLGAFLLYMRAVSRIGPARAALFIHLIPVYGALLSVVFLGETLRPYHAAGFALILTGIVAASRTGGPAQDKN